MNRNQIMISLILLIFVTSLFFFQSSSNRLSDASDLSNESIIDYANISEESSTVTTYTHTFGLYINNANRDNTVSPNIVNRGESDPYVFTIEHNFVNGLTIKGSVNSVDTDLFTHNIPIQKWLYITVVVNDTISELYIDGKLVNSSMQNGAFDTDYEKNITIGDTSDWNANDAFIASYDYYNYNLKPDAILGLYQKFSNKYNTHTRDIYSIDIDFSKDDQSLANLSF